MKISAVVISRNDNYGGNLLDRAYYALYSMYNAFDEVIYIDWNSPGGVSLFDEIKQDLPNKSKFIHYKIDSIFVSELRLPRDAQTCTEVLARNIGIRRASYEWIVSTNIDIIVPLSIKNGFDKSTFYTFARRDIKLEEVKEISSNPFQVQKYLKGVFYDYTPHGYSGINSQDKWSVIDSCGDFQMAHRDVWFKIRGFEEEMIYRGFADSNVQRKAVNAGFNLVASFDYPVFHIAHSGGFGGSGKINDANKYVIQFTGITNNPDTWGFSHVNFKKEIW
jgi:hypothetical protein